MYIHVCSALDGYLCYKSAFEAGWCFSCLRKFSIPVFILQLTLLPFYFYLPKNPFGSNLKLRLLLHKLEVILDLVWRSILALHELKVGLSCVAQGTYW